MIYYGTKDAAFAELSRLAELVGLDIERVAQGDRSRAGVLMFTTSGCPDGSVAATFHDLFAPYFAKGRAELSLRDDTGAILELMVAVGATLRGKVIGVVGSRGGLGASTLAAWLARELAADGHVGLVDADPVSAGIDMLLTIQDEPGKRWADIGGRGALLAGRLVESLPLWHGVRVLSADERGAIPIMGDLGVRAISAVSQVCAWTIVDLPPVAVVDASVARTWLDWCDHALYLVAPDELGLAHAKVGRTRLGPKVEVTCVGAGITGGGQSAHVSAVLGETIVTVRHQKGMVADVDHGVSPGDRARGGVAKDVAVIASHLRAVVP